MAIWLAIELEKLGYRVAILSRGYRKEHGFFPWRAAGNGVAAINDPCDPRCVGDESAMMARWFGQKVGVGKIRYEAAKRLLNEGMVDVFILDDGFQHRRLRRDLDVLLLGSDWNGWMIPAGPFREPRRALGRAHLLVVTGAREPWEPWVEEHRKRGAIFYGTLEPQGLLTMERDQSREKPLALLAGKKIVAVSAIANPIPFYRMIHDWEGEIVDAIEFPDHYEYSTEDWRRINHAARQGDLIVTTEKDLIKLVFFPFAREKLFALRVSMVIQGADSLVQMVREAIQKKRTGHTDAGREGNP
jgi:tetraacyldisaccharide 4'-kinase